MARYKIITLVDITRTDPGRSEVDQLRANQQANFNSLIQAIGLRANVSWDTDPKMNTGTLPNPFNGKANHWIWEFDVEREDVFLQNGDPVGLLMQDLHGVPIIADLKNTADIYPPAFQTKGNNANTTVFIMS